LNLAIDSKLRGCDLVKLRAIQLLLGHTKLESTVRYLGIEVDETLEMAEQTEV
jgi:site-specific recombinase XerD